jgi:hypothetical protein
MRDKIKSGQVEMRSTVNAIKKKMEACLEHKELRKYSLWTAVQHDCCKSYK